MKFPFIFLMQFPLVLWYAIWVKVSNHGAYGKEKTMEKFFKLRENGTDVKTEVIAGITTFMTMAYILAVNPGILSASGMDPQAVMLATAISAVIGCVAMALLAN